MVEQAVSVQLGIPHIRDLPGYFVDSLMTLIRPPGTGMLRVAGKPVDIARNKIVEQFLEGPGTHLFFMDTDMVFEPHTLNRLFAHGKPIVSGTYFARTDTPVPHVYEYARTDENRVAWYRSMAPEFRAWQALHPELAEEVNAGCFPYLDGLTECDAVGGGCLLIAREVLEAIPAPWFECYDTGGGEDFDFCGKAQAAGYKVYADFAIQADHYTDMVFTGRAEFNACFAEVEDFTEPILVEVGKSGRKRFKQPQVQGVQ